MGKIYLILIIPGSCPDPFSAFSASALGPEQPTGMCYIIPALFASALQLDSALRHRCQAWRVGRSTGLGIYIIPAPSGHCPASNYNPDWAALSPPPLLLPISGNVHLSLYIQR